MKYIRRVVAALVASACLASPASAYNADPAPIHFADVVNVFEGLSYDTDWQPANSPIQVRFTISLEGNMDAGLDGQANLTWPEALTLGVAGTENGGKISTTLGLAIKVSIQLNNVLGYTGTYDIEYDPLSQLKFAGEAAFTPFLFGETVEINSPSQRIRLIQQSIPLLAVLSVQLDLDAGGTLTSSITGERLEFGPNQAITAKDQTLRFDVPEGGSLVLPSSYMATLTGGLTLHLFPALEVCAPIGCLTLAQFDIPIELKSNSLSHTFFAQDLRFALPKLALTDSGYDFGNQSINHLAIWELPLQNKGDALLNGSVSMDDASNFRLIPANFTLLPQSGQSLVVVYQPLAEGPATANIRFTSNSPSNPDVNISLSGTGVPDPGADCQDPTDNTKHLPPTGCSCQVGPMEDSWLLLAFGLWAISRRRKW